VPEVCVIAVLFAGQVGVDGVVDVIGPLHVDPIATPLSGSDDLDVIEIRFGDEA